MGSERNELIESRRNFLRAAATGAAGLVAMSAATSRVFAKTTASPWPATGYMQINPDIDNCRVAYITDPAMALSTDKYDFRDWNNTGVDYDVVKANIDKMACALAQKSNAADAWKTIFRKPANKSWEQVKAAIKVNAVGGYSPNVPTVAKLCEVLHDLGVPYANITIFDAGNATGDGCLNKYNQFKTSGKLPAINIAARGPDTQVLIGTETLPIQNVVLESDILITCAVNKGHDQKNKFGGLTMSIKNHTGTIKYGCASSLKQLINYHKSEWILGNPSDTVPVRQQLAFVDSTWAGAPGSWGGQVNNGAVLHTLVMGTLAGPVDYLTATKIRTKLYENTDANNCNITYINQYMTEFGYTEDERLALDTMDPKADAKGRGFVDAAAWSGGDTAIAGRTHVTGALGATPIALTVAGRQVHMNLAMNDVVESATIYTPCGRKIRSLSLPMFSHGAVHLSWDGADDAGQPVRSGAYVVRVKGRSSSAAGQVTISR
jgi:hypothetical protein